MHENLLSKPKLRSYSGLSESIKNLQLISASPSSNTAVYRIKFVDGDVRFVRVLTEERLADLRNITEVGPVYGFPECKVLDGDPPLLLMEKVSGVPLSRLLPIGLFPGLWLLGQSHLEGAMEQFGQYLGRLHKKTETTQRSASETYSLPRYFEIDEQIAQHIGESTVYRLREKSEKISDISLTCGRVHSDPTPHNIFYDGQDVSLIDFRLREDAILTDLIKAERGIELMVDRLPYGRQSQKEILLKSFRHGYLGQYERFTYPNQYSLIRCLMDISLLESHINKRFNKRGALIARRTDISTLKKRILSVAE